MKKYNYILFFLVTLNVFSQSEAFQNFGNVQMHDNANVGFHTNLVNDGKFDENEGFVGFYHAYETLTVSGKNKAIFKNIDVVVPNNLELNTSMGVTNDFSYIEGKVITDRYDPSISLDFINHSFIGGYDNIRHTDGYASVTGNTTFEFPIGNDERLRPMIIPDKTINSFYSGAYFFENPNATLTFNTKFDTNRKEGALTSVNKQEFWDLNGKEETKITLTWDNQSNIFVLAEKLKNLRVVGWNKKTNRWENLGNTNFEGNTDKGKITSKPFIPDTYEIITIGSVEVINEEICNMNYLISPNGDSLNETFEIECIGDMPKNSELSIYNRWGTLVYRIKDHLSKWDGHSYGRSTILKDEKLPVGTYFYMLKYEDEYHKAQIKKGWVYLSR